MTMNDKMGNLNAPGVSEKVTYHDGELFLLDELHNAEEISVIPMDMRVFIFVLQGEASFVFNEKVCTLHGHELFVSMANNVLSRWKSSEDFRCRCICASSAYTQRIVPMTRNLWEVSFWLKKNPVYPLLPEDMEALCRYYDLLCLQRHAALPLQGKIVDTLMQSLSYKIEEVLGRTMNVDPSSFSSGELLFQQFVELLETSYPKSRRVGDYAARLCVTSKYLAVVCKQLGQETPSDIINRFVARDIEYLMKHTQLNVKEISNELEFPNLSFFCKYVKRHFGLSPKELRGKFLAEL